MILIENMARAIGAALAQIEPGVRVGYLSDGEHEELAIAALQAIRDNVTQGMVEAGVEHWHTHGDFLDDEVRGTFTAMIDAALEETVR